MKCCQCQRITQLAGPEHLTGACLPVFVRVGRLLPRLLPFLDSISCVDDSRPDNAGRRRDATRPGELDLYSSFERSTSGGARTEFWAVTATLSLAEFWILQHGQDSDS